MALAFQESWRLSVGFLIVVVAEAGECDESYRSFTDLCMVLHIHIGLLKLVVKPICFDLVQGSFNAASRVICSLIYFDIVGCWRLIQFGLHQIIELGGFHVGLPLLLIIILLGARSYLILIYSALLTCYRIIIK